MDFDTFDIRENYKKLLIDYPKGNPDPFEYTGIEYPYLLYLI